MKRFFTSALAVLLLANLAQAQKPNIVPAHLQKAEKMQTREQLEKAMLQSEARANASQIAPAQQGSLGVASVIATRIGTAQNPNTYLASSQNQIYGLPSIGTNGGTCTFIFRARATDCSLNSGSILYNISTDGGMTWIQDPSNCLGAGPLNPDQTFLARYPEQVTFGKSLADLKMVHAAPSIDPAPNGTWTGDMLLGLASDLTNTAAPTIAQEDYENGASSIYRMTTMVKRGSSDEFWGVAPVSFANGDSALNIYRGLYNSSTNKVDWTIHQHVSLVGLAAHPNPAAPDDYSIGDPTIAFSESGEVGYIAFSGDLVGGRDSTGMLCIMEFNNSTQKFDNPYELLSKQSASGVTAPDMLLYDSLCVHMRKFVDSTNTPLTNRVYVLRVDLEIDSKGLPHILTVITPSVNDGTQLPYYLYSGFGVRVVEFTKDASCEWNARVISDVYRGSDKIGTGSNESNYYCTPYITATPDRSVLFYTWSDSDTSTNTADPIGQPNVIGTVYDVNTGMISDTVNWTYGDATWGGFGRFPKAATMALDRGNGVYHVPTTVLRFPDQTLANAPTLPVEFYYFPNIEYNKSMATKTMSWLMPLGTGSPCNVAITAATNINKLNVYPNPAASKANVSFTLKAADDVTIELIGLNGQVVNARTIKGTSVVNEEINLSNLATGVYLVKVTTSKGVSTEKLIVE